MFKQSRVFFFFLCMMLMLTTQAHHVDYGKTRMREWKINGKEKIIASFLMYKNNEVYLQKVNNETIHMPITHLTKSDQQLILQRYYQIKKLNQQLIPSKHEQTKNTSNNYPLLVAVALLMSLFLLVAYRLNKNHRLRFTAYFAIFALLAMVYGFKKKSVLQSFSFTNPVSVDSAFTPFKPNIVTSWDSNYFYVESFGIPTTHNMMTGIIKWQQQVPIPQCYIKPNAWMIPLNPMIAANPIPVDSIHFTRGAIAVAINGVPIFNYHTNTGVDAYLDGQLDNWGGHCGRADDYHYHIAPLQLYNNTQLTLPIAYALDGFAIYGNYEPDGNAMLPLDANNGHYGSNGVYHYHGISTAPYMIGKMVGEVTEDTTHQIIPQPHAQPVRPSLKPLNGAVITNCIPNTTNNGYTVVYTVGGYTDSVVYNWTTNGIYTFQYYHNGNLDSTKVYNGSVPCQLPTDISQVILNKEDIQVFPNPTNGIFSLKLSNYILPSEIKSITIVSAKGEKIFESNIYQDKINLNTYQPGVYYVAIKSNKKTYVNKILVQ